MAVVAVVEIATIVVNQVKDLDTFSKIVCNILSTTSLHRGFDLRASVS